MLIAANGESTAMATDRRVPGAEVSAARLSRGASRNAHSSKHTTRTTSALPAGIVCLPSTVRSGVGRRLTAGRFELLGDVFVRDIRIGSR